MKAIILKNKNKDDVQLVIFEYTRGKPIMPKLPEGQFTLVKFPENKIINERSARHSINKIKRNENHIIAVATEFTIDAAKYLQSQSIHLIASKGQTFWSDESYDEIKIFTGAKVKRPIRKTDSEKT